LRCLSGIHTGDSSLHAWNHLARYQGNFMVVVGIKVGANGKLLTSGLQSLGRNDELFLTNFGFNAQLLLHKVVGKKSKAVNLDSSISCCRNPPAK
jgi:hypothetical protein